MFQSVNYSHAEIINNWFFLVTDLRKDVQSIIMTNLVIEYNSDKKTIM